MSDRNFSRRRRGGMRFRPSSGLNPNPNRTDREALQARAEAVGGKAPQDKVYDRARHAHEIERSENIAAGLPPEGAPKTETETSTAATAKGAYREPNLETPAEVRGGKAL